MRYFRAAGVAVTLFLASAQIKLGFSEEVTAAVSYSTKALSEAVIQSGTSARSGSVSLSAADGGHFSVSGGLLPAGSSQVTYTLPASNSVEQGWRYRFERDANVNINVLARKGDDILGPTKRRTYDGIEVGPANGDFATLVYIGFGHFEVETASPGEWALLGAVGQAYPPQGSYSYLEANTYTVAGAPATVIVANDLTVRDPADGSSFTIPSINTTARTTLVGPTVNGRDDGSSCTPYENGYIYVVRNPVTGDVGSVRSPWSRPNGPNLKGALAGYTQWAGPLFFTVTDNSCNNYNVEGYNKSYRFTAATNALIPLATGSDEAGATGNVSLTDMHVTSWAKVDVKAVVPPVAREITITFGCDGTSKSSAHILVAPSNSWNAPQGGAYTSIPLVISVREGSPQFNQATIRFLDESTNVSTDNAIYFASDSASCRIQLDGVGMQ